MEAILDNTRDDDPAERAPLVLGGDDDLSITEKVCRIVEAEKPPKAWYLAFGIALSLPLVVWGSGILARLMTRYQWIVWIGGGVLGYVAGELLVKDPAIGRLIGEIAHAVHYPLPIALAIVMTALGWWFARRHPAERIHA